MFDTNEQKNIEIPGSNSKVVGGDDYSETHIHSQIQQTKLSALFDRLNKEFVENSTVNDIHEDLLRFQTERDAVGLQRKLDDGNVQYLYDDAVWLKQEYAKKLTKFALFEPAQQIHAFLLAIVIEKFRNNIYPMFRDSKSHAEIMKCISENIVDPILNIIRQEGCNDVMGLCSTDIEGMVYYLTGLCHIKWKV